MEKNKNGLLSRILVPGLCALFLILALGLALMGTNIYRGTVAAADADFARRTGLSYLSNQIRRADSAGSIRVGSFGGSDALALSDNAGYVTYIYCYDGALRELYTDPADGLQPADGTELIPAESLKIEAADGVLTLCLDGSSVTLRPHCGFEEVPQL